VRKPLLIGCGALLVLVFAAFALFVVYQNSIMAWVFEAMQMELAPRLPEDLPPDVRDRYDHAFDLAIAAAHDGNYSPQDLQRVQREFSRMVQDGGAKLSVEEVQRLTEVLEAVPAHGEAAAPPPEAEAVPKTPAESQPAEQPER